MKVVIFCGGLGIRIGATSGGLPKPLVKIGYRPIIWHLMSYYAIHGHTDFILCLGHYGDSVRDFFYDYRPHQVGDFAMIRGKGVRPDSISDVPDWNISFVDTGLKSSIGERLCRVRDYIKDEPIFLANYSDGLSDLPLNRFVKDFTNTDAVGGFVSVKPDYSSHGVYSGEDGYVSSIKAAEDMGLWINGGFMVLRNEIFDYIKQGEDLVGEPFNRLVKARKLWTHRYTGFWRSMDTAKDNLVLQRLWENETTPWLDPQTPA